MTPLEIIRKRIAFYENGKAEMALYESKLLKKTKWSFDKSQHPFEATPYQMGFDFIPAEKKTRIEWILEELKLIEKEILESEIR